MQTQLFRIEDLGLGDMENFNLLYLIITINTIRKQILISKYSTSIQLMRINQELMVLIQEKATVQGIRVQEIQAKIEIKEKIPICKLSLQLLTQRTSMIIIIFHPHNLSLNLKLDFTHKSHFQTRIKLLRLRLNKTKLQKSLLLIMFHLFIHRRTN